MSAEYATERIADLLLDSDWATEVDEPTEDMRTGGFFFDVTVKGRQYEVLVTEFNGGAE